MARVYVQRRDLPADIRRLFDAMWDGGSIAETAAELSPPMDVLETAEAIEILLDVPGVARGSIEIVFAGGVLMIAGQKSAPACTHGDAAFHLAERSFGRFARALGVDGAFDAGRARATLSHGELRIVLPRIPDRRGQPIKIAIG